MAKFKLNKPVLLQEEFAAGEVSNPGQNVTPAAKTEPASVAVDKTDAKGAEIRAEIIADVDTILTNLETLSKQITESVLNENVEEIIKSIKAKVAYAKGEAMLKNYEKVLTAANQNTLDKQKADSLVSFNKALEKITTAKANAKGDAKKPLIAKEEAIKAKITKIESRVEAVKAKADNSLAEFKEKLGKIEGEMADPLKSLFTTRKLRLERNVQEAGLELKAKMAQEAGNKKAAEEAKKEMEQIAAKQKELEEKIKAGELEASDDVEELSGIKPFLPEVSALMKAQDNVRKIKSEISNASAAYEGVSFEDNFELAYELMYTLNEDISTLYSGAKGEEDSEVAVKQLGIAKKLAAALKKASQEEYAAKKSLYDKVKGQETNKSVITLAGGDDEKAEETGDGKFKIGALIPKWGGDSGFISAEEFGDIKKSDEILQTVDDAIVDVQTRGEEEEETPTTTTTTTEAEAETTTTTTTEALEDSVQVENVEEGNAFGAARAEAIAKGEKTFKVGDEEYDVESVDAEDKENAEEYAEEEGIATEAVVESASFKMGSIADRFRSLM